MIIRGFTLIETLIYTAVFALLVAGTFASEASLEMAARHTDAQLALQEKANNEAEYMSLYLRDSRVTIPLPNATSSRLTFTSGASVITFDAKSFDATNVLFERIGAPDDPDHMRMTLVLTTRSDGLPLTATATRTVYLQP
jgi:Tfp pilus assembly protein PilE